MSVKLPVLEILQSSDHARADDALVDGLARAEPDYRWSLVEVILARKSNTGLAGMVAHFHRFDAKLQRVVLDQSDVLFGVLRVCVKARESQTRRNTVELIGRIGSYRLAYLLSLALHDPIAGIRQRAAEALRELADRYLRQERITLEVLTSQRTFDSKQAAVQTFSLARLGEERSYLISALSDAVNDYEVHRRSEVAEVVVWFANYINDALLRAVTNRLSSCGRAVSEVVQASRDPRAVPFVYEALCHRDLRSAAARAVSEQLNDAFMTEFVRWGFLVAHGRVRRGVAAIRNLAWLGRGGQRILQLDAALYGRAVDLVLATAMGTERKVAVCRDLVLADSPAAQRAGLWGLVALEDDMSTRLICNVVQSKDPELSGIAIREIMRRCPKDLASLLAHQGTSDSPAIRQMIGEQMGDYGFDQYWQTFDVLDEEDRRYLGRVLLTSGKDMLQQLRAKLASSKPSDRLRVIQIVSTLDIVKQLESEIYRAAYDRDAFVRSSVMGLLGSLPGPTTERILLNGLNDSDDRVQANSIESLDRLRAVNRFRQIRVHLNSENNRTRANAVKALLSLQSREAGAILLEMLEHDEAAQRLSALWVAEVLKLMTVSARVLKLAKHDPDPSVRRRALQAVSVLTAALKDESDKTAPADNPAEEVAS